MMTLPKKCIAISGLVCGLLALCMAQAQAGTAVGVVTQVNGPLLLKRADGAIKAIALDSYVEQGDTLVTEKNTYAQFKFADDSEVTLKPGTQLTIEVLVFNAGNAENVDTVFSLAQGAIQIKTGAAARSRPENIKLVMPSLVDPVASATVDRKAGTTFVAEYIAESAASQLARFDSRQLADRYPAVQLAATTTGTRSDGPLFSLPANWDAAMQLAQINIPGGAASSRPPGLYVQVLDGIINLSNKGGSLNFSAGQFGFTPNFRQPPVMLPANPGLKFTPPPSFSSPSVSPGNSGAGSKPKSVDCEVR